MVNVATVFLVAAMVVVLIAGWVLVTFAVAGAYRERSVFKGVLAALFVGCALGLTGIGLFAATHEWPTIGP